MAKKRMARSKMRSKKPKKLDFSKIASSLVYIALFFLTVNSIIIIFMRDTILQSLNNAGITASASLLAFMGLLWLMLAFFAWSLNRNIRENMKRSSMWELLILSVITLISGRFESGILILIASVIYLVKSKK